MKISINFFWWTVGLFIGGGIMYAILDMSGDLSNIPTEAFFGLIIGGALGEAFTFYGISKAFGVLTHKVGTWWTRRKTLNSWSRITA